MTAIIDHIGIAVTDMARAKAFYAKALGAIGITQVSDYGTAVGYGRTGKPDFWLGAIEERAVTRTHVCFTAESRAQVDAFYAAALEAGGRDNGAPGLRAQYHPGYYGAFVLCPDGHNVEAVVHEKPVK